MAGWTILKRGGAHFSGSAAITPRLAVRGAKLSVTEAGVQLASIGQEGQLAIELWHARSGYQGRVELLARNTAESISANKDTSSLFRRYPKETAVGAVVDASSMSNPAMGLSTWAYSSNNDDLHNYALDVQSSFINNKNQAILVGFSRRSRKFTTYSPASGYPTSSGSPNTYVKAPGFSAYNSWSWGLGVYGYVAPDGAESGPAAYFFQLVEPLDLTSYVFLAGPYPIPKQVPAAPRVKGSFRSVTLDSEHVLLLNIFDQQDYNLVIRSDGFSMEPPVEVKTMWPDPVNRRLIGMTDQYDYVSGTYSGFNEIAPTPTPALQFAYDYIAPAAYYWDGDALWVWDKWPVNTEGPPPRPLTGLARLRMSFGVGATAYTPPVGTTIARTPVMTPTTTEFVGAPPRLHLAHHLGYRSGRVTSGTRPHIGELAPLRMTMNRPFASYVDHWKGRSKPLTLTFTLFAVDKGAAAVLTARFFFDGSIDGDVIQAAKAFLHFDMDFHLPTAGAFHIEMLHQVEAAGELGIRSNAAELSTLRFRMDAYGLAGKPGLLALVRFRLNAHGVNSSDDNEVDPIRFQFRLWATARWASATGDLMALETWWGEREWVYWWRSVWGWNGYGYVYQGRVKEWYWRYKTETWPYGVVTKLGERRDPFTLTFTLFAAPDMYGTSHDNLMRFDQWGRAIAEYRGKAKLLLRFRYINFTGKVTSKGQLDPLLAWFDILVGDAMEAEPLDPEDMHLTFVLTTRGNEYVTWLFPPRPVRIVSDVYEATGVVHEVGD